MDKIEKIKKIIDEWARNEEGDAVVTLTEIMDVLEIDPYSEEKGSAAPAVEVVDALGVVVEKVLKRMLSSDPINALDMTALELYIQGVVRARLDEYLTREVGLYFLQDEGALAGAVHAQLQKLAAEQLR